MLEGEVQVVNPLGLHARAAAQLVRVSGGFESRVLLRTLSRPAEADAKSMLEVLTLAASVNTILTLIAEGEDEADAFNAIKQLFEAGFGEI